MGVLMLLLLILAAALITVAVQATHIDQCAQRRDEDIALHTTLTHQSYADAGGCTTCAEQHSKAYGTVQKVEAKARDWIQALSTSTLQTAAT